MLFCYFNERYQTLKYSYLLNYKVGYGVFSTIKIEGKLSPFTSSGIDLSKYNVYKKIHQEYLERFRIAHNLNNLSEFKSFNPFIKQITTHSRNIMGYGFNDEYGKMDTTGTASGLPSEALKEKALFELIEKNEAMLIWYLGKGHNVLTDKSIEQLINKIGFNSKDIYIFCSNNLCNLTTFVVLLFNDGKIISSGVNIDKDSNKALKNALLEAKLLESFFRDSEISPYKLFNQYQHKEIHKHVENLSKKMGNIRNVCSVQQNVILLPWITSIEFAVLNTKPYQDFITIRCFSKELLNSIPSKKNILSDLNKKILKQYCINEESIFTKPPCIIL